VEGKANYNLGYDTINKNLKALAKLIGIVEFDLATGQAMRALALGECARGNLNENDAANFARQSNVAVQEVYVGAANGTRMANQLNAVSIASVAERKLNRSGRIKREAEEEEPEEEDIKLAAPKKRRVTMDPDSEDEELEALRRKKKKLQMQAEIIELENQVHGNSRMPRPPFAAYPPRLSHPQMHPYHGSMFAGPPPPPPYHSIMRSWPPMYQQQNVDPGSQWSGYYGSGEQGPPPAPHGYQGGYHPNGGPPPNVGGSWY
jgi:hypothetical protein